MTAKQRAERRIMRRHRAARRRAAELRRRLAVVEAWQRQADRWLPYSAEHVARLEALEQLAAELRGAGVGRPPA